MVIVDTTVWIDYLRGAQNPESQWLNSEMGNQRLALTDIILCEVLQGVADDNSFNDVRRDLLQFEIFATGGVEFALAAAQNFRALRQRGHTVRRTVDCLIATFLQNRRALIAPQGSRL